MNALPPFPSDELCQALAEFLDRSDAGQPVDRQKFIAEHPLFCDELQAFFEVADRLERIGMPLDSPGIRPAAFGETPHNPRSQDTVDRSAETLEAPHSQDPRLAVTREQPANLTHHGPSPGDGHTKIPTAFRSAHEREESPRQAQPPVRRFFGDYEILQELAQGGMGVVYKARQRKLNRVVALKMILSGRLANAVEVERFYAEAEAAANLRHPNIVNVYEIGEIEGRHFFSMEFIEGRNLSDMVHRQPLDPRHAAQLAKTIAETIQFAHDRGVIHRDLKPSNVLVDARGEPMITDFGVAKRIGGGNSQVTTAGTIVGTPSYMPPEQARGADVTRLADVYSIGAILYELLTASPPFSAASPSETLKQVLEMEPVAPRARNPNLPRDLETICLKCMQKEPSRRYASAGELAEDLGRYLRGEPIRARRVGVMARFWRWCRRNPELAG